MEHQSSVTLISCCSFRYERLFNKSLVVQKSFFVVETFSIQTKYWLLFIFLARAFTIAWKFEFESKQVSRACYVTCCLAFLMKIENIEIDIFVLDCIIISKITASVYFCVPWKSNLILLRFIVEVWKNFKSFPPSKLFAIYNFYGEVSLSWG